MYVILFNWTGSRLLLIQLTRGLFYTVTGHIWRNQFAFTGMDAVRFLPTRGRLDRTSAHATDFGDPPFAGRIVSLRFGVDGERCFIHSRIRARGAVTDCGSTTCGTGDDAVSFGCRFGKSDQQELSCIKLERQQLPRLCLSVR